MRPQKMSETEHGRTTRPPETEEERRAQKVERYLTFARHALHRYRLDEAAGHYDVVREIAPDNMEAIFYGAYCRAVASLGQQAVAEREAAFAALVEAIRAIETAYPTTTEDKEAVLSRIDSRMRNMVNIPFAYEGTGDDVGGLIWGLNLIHGAEDAYAETLKRLANAQRAPLPRRLTADDAPKHDAQWHYRVQEKRYKHGVTVGLTVGSIVGVVGAAAVLGGVLYFGGMELLPLGVLGAAAILITAPVIGWQIGGKGK